ncbi:MAG: hypothetical protein KatS3mg110_0161 [Pirellulaceae bacterium]|nr:MAG: hypothetical protein KatS3mg110_0161 [Pirellulaceae bacterium]
MDVSAVVNLEQARLLQRRRIYLGASFVLFVAAAVAVAVDLPLARWWHTDPLPGDIKRVVNSAEFFGHGLSVLLVIWAASVLDGRGWKVAWRLAGSAFLAGAASSLVKVFVARLRPSAALELSSIGDTFAGWLPVLSLGKSWGYSFQSFPSSHTATAAGLAVALCTLYPRGKYVFVIMVILVACQRLSAEAHFLSDVLSGAAIGMLVGGLWCTSRLFRSGL